MYTVLVEKLGSPRALDHLSKSIFVFIVGSNDILDYVRSSSNNQSKITYQQFVGSMISSLEGQLKVTQLTKLLKTMIISVTHANRLNDIL